MSDTQSSGLKGDQSAECQSATASYKAFLQRKVDLARAEMRAGIGRSADGINAEFAAMRAALRTRG